MNKEQIMKLIEEGVSIDIYGDLHGHERVAEIIAAHFICLEAENKRLREVNSDMGWRDNPDRMGGQFTREEIERKWHGWR